MYTLIVTVTSENWKNYLLNYIICFLQLYLLLSLSCCYEKYYRWLVICTELGQGMAKFSDPDLHVVNFFCYKLVVHQKDTWNSRTRCNCVCECKNCGGILNF